MKMQQFIGPFQNNDLELHAENVTYLQIGIEYPYSIPLLELEEENNNIIWPLIVTINSQDFIITDKNILELKLNHESINIRIHKNLSPYIIINVAYENAN